jgi:hypothetical protein
MNNGQTCIAPDYVLVHASKQDQLLAELKKALQKLYGADPHQSPDLARVVNDRNFQRLRRLLDDAVSKGARVAIGGNMDEAERYIAPTVLTHLSDDMDIQHEEIFGPILPIIAVQNREEALAFIRRRPKPLDMYIGSRNQANIHYFSGKHLRRLHRHQRVHDQFQQHQPALRRRQQQRHRQVFGHPQLPRVLQRAGPHAPALALRGSPHDSAAFQRCQTEIVEVFL